MSGKSQGILRWMISGNPVVKRNTILLQMNYRYSHLQKQGCGGRGVLGDVYLEPKAVYQPLQNTSNKQY